MLKTHARGFSVKVFVLGARAWWAGRFLWKFCHRREELSVHLAPSGRIRGL